MTFASAKLLLKSSFGTLRMPRPCPIPSCPHPHVPYDDTLLMQFRLSDEFFNVRRFPHPPHLPLHVAFAPADALPPLFKILDSEIPLFNSLRLLLPARVDALKSATTTPQTLLNTGACLSPCSIP